MKRNTIKRALAGVLVVLFVAGYLPANVGTGGLFAIVASAATSADGITFTTAWSSNSLPQPEWDAYTTKTAGTGHFPVAKYYYLDNNITVNTVTLRPEEYATEKKQASGVQVGWYRRYCPLDSDNSVSICLNGHTINAGGNDMMTQVDDYGLKQCHYESFVYAYYGNGGANDVITNANSMGINYGGTWVLNGVKLTNFANIVELSGNVRWSDKISLVNGGYDTNYYGPYAATLNMKNATATCVNGVKITDGNFNITDSVINSSGNYAVKLVKGSFRINGNSEINGAVVLSDNQKISFSNGATLTGNVKIKFDGKTPNGSPCVITSGAANANIPEGTFTSDDGYYFEKNNSGEWVVYASAPDDVSGGVINGVEDEYILTNGGSIAFPSYTVKDTTGKTLTKNTDYTVAIRKDGNAFSGTNITQQGTYVIQITGKGNYTGTLSKTFTVGSYGSATLGGYTFNTLSNGSIYAITSAEDWNNLSSVVSSGNNCNNLSFKLMNDISVNRMIGNAWNKYFSGIFDGNGNTVTINVSNGNIAGTFSSLKNSTIKNLKVAGSINAPDLTGKACYAGGIAAYTDTNFNIENCAVNATISSEDYSGGIIGNCATSSGSNKISCCVFNGTISSGDAKGGIIGYISYGQYVSISNCLSLGNNYNIVGRAYKSYYPTITNCYRTVSGSQGTLVYTAEYENGISSDLGDYTEYINGLKVYTTAMEYNGVTYAPQNTEITVDVNAPHGYSVKSVKYNSAEAERVGATQYKFNMPNTNVSVTAEYEQSLVTVTWVDGNGNVIMTDEVQRNTVPTYSGSTPTKAGDAQYSYVFSGWSPALSAITANTTYTAQFEQIPNTYTVTWKNADGTVLETDTDVPYGTTPTYDGETPTKDGDAQYTYTFTGWDTTPVAVTGDVTYTAQFSEAVNKYTITWIDGDGNTLKTEQVAYGTTPTYNGEKPAKTGEDNEVFVFNGWDTEPTAVTGDMTYTAQFIKYTKVSATLATYTSAGNSEYYTCEDGKYYVLVNGEYREIAENSWVIPQLTLVHHEAVAPTCTTDGNIEYWYDEANNKYFSDANGEHEITQADTVRAATNHDWNAPTYSWTAVDSGYKCTAIRTCKNNASHEETEEAVVTYAEITAPTAGAKGLGRYTATFTNSAFAVQTKDVEIEMLTPEYADATYTWAADNSSVTAEKKCLNGGADITETVNTTSQITKPATCKAMGETTYYATFTNEVFAAQEKTVANIATTDHIYTESSPIWSWVKNGDSYDVSVKFKCSICGDIEECDEEPELSFVDEDGYRTYTASVEFEDDTYTMSRRVKLSYNVTVNGVTTQYAYDEIAEAKITTIDEGKFFDGWYEGDKKVSSLMTYTFTVRNDVTLEARFVDSAVQAEPILNFSVSEREVLANGKNKLSFIVEWELPDDCTLVQAAIIRSYTNTDPKYNSSDATVKVSTLRDLSGSYKYNLTLGTASASKTIYARGYIIYLDKNGTSHQMYTDVIVSNSIS